MDKFTKNMKKIKKKKEKEQFSLYVMSRGDNY